MLCAVTLQDTVRIHPKDFGLPIREAAFRMLTAGYGGRVIPGKGFCILVDQVLEVLDQRLPHNDAGAYVDVVFTVLLFNPYPGEILSGTIVAQHPEDGLAISLGFFSGVVVLPSQLPEGAFFAEKYGCFVWHTNDQEYYYDTGARVKFRVLGCRYIDWSSEKPRAAKAAERSLDVARDWPGLVRERGTMCVQGSMAEAGLGNVLWWRGPPDAGEAGAEGVDAAEAADEADGVKMEEGAGEDAGRPGRGDPRPF